MTTPRTIDDYIDLAKERAGLSSDRELARRLGKLANPTTQWRTRRSWPADGTMVKIARLAGVDPCQAVLDLSRWRSTDDQAREVWTELAGRAWRAGVLTGGVLLAFMVSTVPAEAAVHVGNSLTAGVDLYVLWKIRFRRAISRTLAHGAHLARQLSNPFNNLIAV